MIQHRRTIYGETLYHTLWLFGVILIWRWRVDEAEYDGGDARWQQLT